MSNNSTTRTGGISFFGALGILFIGLKLGNVIDWSWPWVLAPFWLPLTVIFGAVVVVWLVALLVVAAKRGRA